MTNRRERSTINLAKKVSREVEALLLMLLGSPVSLEEASGATLVVEAHSRAERSRFLRLAPGVGLVEADSTRRTRRRFLSEYPGDVGRVIKSSDPTQADVQQLRRNGWYGWYGWYGYGWNGRNGWNGWNGRY